MQLQPCPPVTYNTGCTYVLNDIHCSYAPESCIVIFALLLIKQTALHTVVVAWPGKALPYLIATKSIRHLLILWLCAQESGVSFVSVVDLVAVSISGDLGWLLCVR